MRPPAVHHELLDGRAIPTVEQAMTRLIDRVAPDRLGHMAQQHLATGGKRLRARVALAAGSALGVDPDRACTWAAAVELLHNATLVHDDIQDRDRERRGRPTLWLRYGMAQALNVGDLMLMLPMLAVEHLDVDPATQWALVRAVGARSVRTVRGQNMDVELENRVGVDWQDYVRVARAKSGQLIALSVEGALLLAGRTADVAQRSTHVFADLGVLFQLQDDVADLLGGKGRRRGSDLRKGKASAVVVAHLARHPHCRWLPELLANPSIIDDAIVDVAIERLRAAGTLQWVLDEVNALLHGVATSPTWSETPELRGIAMALVDWIALRVSGWESR